MLRNDPNDIKYTLNFNPGHPTPNAHVFERKKFLDALGLAAIANIPVFRSCEAAMFRNHTAKIGNVVGAWSMADGGEPTLAVQLMSHIDPESVSADKFFVSTVTEAAHALPEQVSELQVPPEPNKIQKIQGPYRILALFLVSRLEPAVPKRR